MRWLIARCTAVLFVVLISMFARVVDAAPGSFDATFGGTGRTIFGFEGTDDSLSAMAMLPDGKIILAGSCSIQGDYDFCLARLRADGTLDTGAGVFGSAGKVTAVVGVSNDFATAIAVQKDGKIVVAGHCTGSSGPVEFCLMRFNPNGSVDSSFNGNGRVFTSIFGIQDQAWAVAIQTDGKIVAAGQCVSSGQRVPCYARYTTTGSLDNTFGSAGKATGNANVTARANGIGFSLSGEVFVASYDGSTLNDRDINLIRRTSDGSFTAGNSFDIDVGGSTDTSAALIVQPDGKVVVVGTCTGGGLAQACATRVSTAAPTLALDATFNVTGKWVGTYGDVNAYAAAIQPDGRIVIAGGCFVGGFNRFCALRLTPEGTLDASFTSYDSINMGAGGGNARAVALDAAGRIVMAGECKSSSGSAAQFCVIRVEGGPFGYQTCKMDLDGDGTVLATTDALMLSRIALGMTGSAVVGSVSFPVGATRTSWAAIRNFLVSQCGMSLAP